MGLYFACMMELQKQESVEIKICDKEVMNYRWVPLSEYGSFAQ